MRIFYFFLFLNQDVLESNPEKWSAPAIGCGRVETNENRPFLAKTKWEEKRAGLIVALAINSNGKLWVGGATSRTLRFVDVVVVVN